MTKYVGMDVHKTSTTLVTLDDEGQQVRQAVIQTRPRELIAAVDGYDERTEVVFEEAQWAAWLYEQLRPHVDRVAVHAADDQANKTDRRDAARLAKWLRLDELDEVYHGSEVDTELKWLVKGYHRAARDVRENKNRLRSLFTTQQIDVSSAPIYDPEHRTKWVEKLDGEGMQLRAIQSHEKLELARRQKAEMKDKMEEAARRRDGWEWVSSLPGFGVVRTSTVLGLIGTPWRFPEKQHLWSYIGLAVDFRESSEYEKNDDGQLERRDRRRTRGLTDDYNRQLKDAFRGAVESAINNYDEVWEDFEARCQRKDESKAKLDIARKLAAQCWTIWKRQEEYDADKACWDQL